MEIQQESVMMSAMRSFCKALFGAAGFFIGIIVIGVAALLFLSSSYQTPKTDLFIAPDAEGNREPLSHTAPVILRINIHGEIGAGKLTGQNIELQLQDSQGPIIKKGRVKGVLLHLNTPGGTVNDSDIIYSALNAYHQRFNVPIYAYVEGMCASGGMYISSSCQKSFATPVSVLGSVGVRYGPYFNISSLMDEYGVKEKTFTAGKDKNMLSPYRQWQPGEDASFQVITEHYYNRFVDIVTQARPKVDRNKLISEYGAQMYDAQTAETIGFVDDGNSSYSAALTALCEKAGISQGEKYQVIELMPQKFLIADLLEGKAFGLDKLKTLFDKNLSNQCFYLCTYGQTLHH